MDACDAIDLELGGWDWYETLANRNVAFMCFDCGEMWRPVHDEHWPHLPQKPTCHSCRSERAQVIRLTDFENVLTARQFQTLMDNNAVGKNVFEVMVGIN